MKDFFAVMGGGNKKGLQALVADDFEWIIPGKYRPLASTYPDHKCLAEILLKTFETIEKVYSAPP